MAELTYDEISKLLKYDPETGRLFWRKRSPDQFTGGRQTAQHNCNAWNGKHAGQEALTADDGHGYRQGAIFDQKYQAHRVIWLLANREWPANKIDHINGIRDDNRLANLRSVTDTENCKNSRIRSDNTSGVIGVCWSKSSRKWHAQIYLGKRKTHIGYFTDLAQAIKARKAAEVEFGYHPNHGRH